MAKTICTVLGIAFILIGLLGFVAPGMLGMHLNLAHNIVHLVSGALALYLGLKGTLSAARTFCIVFGVVYLLLGVVGFIAGGPAAHGVAGVPAAHHGATDSSLLRLLPGALELASVDHIVHILLGIVFLIGGFLTKADVRRAVD
ncbi:MAG TPA: DUF4383 domain-containing protein [Pyrinomonadaceae bacterium]|nr:DUF4383 domain-containing protein [Pyrinomonadaceae bacterium]